MLTLIINSDYSYASTPYDIDKTSTIQRGYEAHGSSCDSDGGGTEVADFKGTYETSSGPNTGPTYFDLESITITNIGDSTSTASVYRHLWGCTHVGHNGVLDVPGNKNTSSTWLVNEIGGQGKYTVYGYAFFGTSKVRIQVKYRKY
jgi:hypothetical protein